ncbi:putative fatty acyl-CoA reductase CG5065 isoform X2 [Prorops nasuta]|uniref:putative fatty acyl-CoA reductase CG5065 isoform X2 n=1 Tax=Prorops nasuta TaxID=863751 RepID=UPI0034CE598B
MGTTNAQTDAEHSADVINPSGTSVEAFFAEAVILVTGATGFLGKAIVEKLLRACPRIATIFILIRPKRGQTVEQRFNQFLNNSIFDRIRWECPTALSKIQPVKGDVSLGDLGLSEEDRAMLTQRVNIVFHSAATVRFDEPLKVAVNLNTRGTDRIIELCKNMNNLVSVIHVSTAYSNADQTDVREMIYTSKLRPYTAIDMCENLDDGTLDIVERKVLGKHPNTYTLTKGLAEDIVQTKGSNLPIAIVRPSIIGSAYQEPFPGWVDSICGITGIMTEIGRGTIRSIVCNDKLIVDVIPVDFVVDTIICAACHIAMQPNGNIRVYNCTSSTYNPVRWREWGQLTQKHAVESPSKYVMWYPGFTFRTNKFIHKLVVALFHFLPAFIIDLILRFQGGKPKMFKITKKTDRAAQVGTFFSTNEWIFHGNNMEELAKWVKASNDRNRFNVDVKTLDWDAYVQKYMLGIRKYILKENPDTLSKARSRLLKLYWLHKIFQILSVFFLIKLITRAGR